MIACSTETICSNCSHRLVCSFMKEFLTAQDAVNKVTVSTGDRSFIDLKDINWIRPVKLQCIYHEEGNPKCETPVVR